MGYEYLSFSSLPSTSASLQIATSSEMASLTGVPTFFINNKYIGNYLIFKLIQEQIIIQHKNQPQKMSLLLVSLQQLSYSSHYNS